MIFIRFELIFSPWRGDVLTLILKDLNTINVTRIRTKRLELLTHKGTSA